MASIGRELNAALEAAGGELSDASKVDALIRRLDEAQLLAPADRVTLRVALSTAQFPLSLRGVQDALVGAHATEQARQVDGVLAECGPQVAQLGLLIDGWGGTSLTDAQSAQLGGAVRSLSARVGESLAWLDAYLHALGSSAGREDVQLLVWDALPPNLLPPAHHRRPHAFQREHQLEVEGALCGRRLAHLKLPSPPPPPPPRQPAGQSPEARLHSVRTRSTEYAHDIDVLVFPRAGDGAPFPAELLSGALERVRAHRELALSAHCPHYLGAHSTPAAAGARAVAGGARPAPREEAANSLGHACHAFEAARGVCLAALGGGGGSAAHGQHATHAAALHARAAPLAEGSVLCAAIRHLLAQALYDCWTQCTRALLPGAGAAGAAVRLSHAFVEVAHLSPHAGAAARGAVATLTLKLHGLEFGGEIADDDDDDDADAPDESSRRLATSEPRSAFERAGEALGADLVRLVDALTRREGEGAERTRTLAALHEACIAAPRAARVAAAAAAAANADMAGASAPLAAPARPSLAHLHVHPYFAPLGRADAQRAAHEWLELVHGIQLAKLK